VPPKIPDIVPEIIDDPIVHKWAVRCIIKKLKIPANAPAIAEASIRNILNPFVKDFLYNPTIIEVDKTPNETRANITRRNNNVKIIPKKKIPNRINKKNSCIAEMSAEGSYLYTFGAGVKESACTECMAGFELSWDCPKIIKSFREKSIRNKITTF